MSDITFPVHASKSAVYDMVIDAEDRLIAFVTINLNSFGRAAEIVAALNEKHERDLTPQRSLEFAS